jgi:hypothetical protein
MTKEIFNQEGSSIRRAENEFNKWWGNLKEDVKGKWAYAKEFLKTVYSPTMTMQEAQVHLDKLDKKRKSEKKAIKAKRVLNSNASN